MSIPLVEKLDGVDSLMLEDSPRYVMQLIDEAASALRSSEAEQRVTVAPNVDGQDFYELCQAYRHSKEISLHPSMPNTVQAFNNLREYIKAGKLPWPSYERSTDTEGSK